MIKEVIREIADESGRAQIDDVISRLSEKNFSKEEVRRQIDMFLRAGEAMEPKSGVIKLI